MRRAAAVAVVALAVLASAAALLFPWPAVLVLLVASVAAMPRRVGFVIAAAAGALVNAAFFALLMPGGGLSLGPVVLSLDGALLGLVGAARLAALLGANVALLARVPVEAVLDGLRLPP